ncbi:hypothetical protein BDCR2A_01148 [Borrelia duttonii CR2A]|uniref:Uncharacterized protein n=1 Tax=Borrelia duttonii CR2A TaxID=1432657 RepID=W6THK3_9SPIR|nr:hypothetical protein BDCR2A_01148 [Borrelia duttonii CR2A]
MVNRILIFLIILNKGDIACKKWDLIFLILLLLSV